jgi:hypothetical protein
MLYNPLATWLLNEIKQAPRIGDRLFAQRQEALQELDFWLLLRLPDDQFSRIRDAKRLLGLCALIDEFPAIGFGGEHVQVGVFVEESIMKAQHTGSL